MKKKKPSAKPVKSGKPTKPQATKKAAVKVPAAKLAKSSVKAADAKPAKATKPAKALKPAKPAAKVAKGAKGVTKISAKASTKVAAKPVAKTAAKPLAKASGKTAGENKSALKTGESLAKPANKKALKSNEGDVAKNGLGHESDARPSKTDNKAMVINEVPDQAEDVVLTDAEGRRYCRVKDCDRLAEVDAYCRYHYILMWKNIQTRRHILQEGKLERYIEELTARYPDKFLEILKKDLRSEKDFLAAIQELEIDESAVEAEFDDEESQSDLFEIQRVSDSGGGARSEEDDRF